MRKILILACSATKRPDPRPLPAIARYDGPAWRTLRKHMTCAIDPPLALSAEHGLISAYQEIADYDRRMTAERAAELVPIVAGQLRELGLDPSAEILFFGGEAYRNLILYAARVADLDELRLAIRCTAGGIGEQLGQLKAWLTGASS